MIRTRLPLNETALSMHARCLQTPKGHHLQVRNREETKRIKVGLAIVGIIYFHKRLYLFILMIDLEIRNLEIVD